ncbi:unnamed protein product [Sphenostylis stenocarpa]|uniref:Uncharacterized protein n=1 Tax=Sphenostylis stenocarpa TaxID=92480 RepID=A0AA86V7S5_9FABA|nr:unnamed protein product [Sphenostylis stenocarpa]
MGLSLQKLAPGSTSNSLIVFFIYWADNKKLKELDPIIEEVYEKLVGDEGTIEFPVFYRAVCEIVEKLNENLGNTQIKLPATKDLEKEFDKREKKKEGKNNPLTKTEFQEIMKNLVKTSGFTGIGAKESILCIFGVPLAALFVKQKVMPEAIRDEFFIPGVTSATVFTLAALNKI